MPSVEEYRTRMIAQIDTAIADGSTPIPENKSTTPPTPVKALSDDAKNLLTEYKNHMIGVTGKGELQSFTGFMDGKAGAAGIDEIRVIYNGHHGTGAPKSPVAELNYATFGNKKGLPLDSPGVLVDSPAGDDKDGKKEGKGLLGGNMGLMIGGLLGGLLGMATGGGMLMGLLLALVGAFIGGTLVDGGDGLLGGLFGGKKDGAGHGKKGDDDTRGAGKGRSRGTTTPTVEPTYDVGLESEVEIRKADGSVVVAIGKDGSPEYGADKGNANPDFTFKTKQTGTDPSYKITGHVEGNKFVVSSVAAQIPGSKDYMPPTYYEGADRPTATIDGTGKINLGDIADTDLAVARAMAKRGLDTRDSVRSMLTTTVAGTPPTVTAKMEPVTRNGVEYVTTLIGSENSGGSVTFNRATLTADGVTVKSPSGNDEFKMNPPFNVNKEGRGNFVSIKEIDYNRISDHLSSYAINTDKENQRLETQRGENLANAIRRGETAGEGLNNMAARLKGQLIAGNEDPGRAHLISERVANYYAQGDVRSKAFNQAEFEAYLSGGVRAMGAVELSAVSTEMEAHHNTVRLALNNKKETAAAGSPVIGNKDITDRPTTSAKINESVEVIPTPGLPGAKGTGASI